MIQPTDLRIGNLLYPTIMRGGIRMPQQVHYKVVKLHASHLMCVSVRAEENPALVASWANLVYTEIEPIPLSEEWLKRMWFEDPGKRIAGLKGKGYMSLLVTKHQMILWNDGQWEMSCNVNGQAVQMPCPQFKYVHKFQNWYFENSGSELTYE